MTEQEWLSCSDPQQMLAFLKGRTTDRKCRLLFVAFWRRRFGPMRRFKAYKKKVVQAEEMADGYVIPKARDAGWIGLQQDAYKGVVHLVRLFGKMPLEREADLVQDVFGNPFRPVTIDRAWLQWHDGVVTRLAQAVYDERSSPKYTLDPDRLVVLGDAMEEAGCSDSIILGHLRGPLPHVRGCFILDLLLGKE